MDGVFYVNDGISSNENENPYATSSLENCYDSRRWKVDSFGVITDTPTNAFMRAPGKTKLPSLSIPVAQRVKPRGATTYLIFWLYSFMTYLLL